MRHGHHSRRQSLAVSSRSGVLGSPPLGAPVGSRRETTPFSDRDPVVRQSQPTIVLCLLLWSNGSSVTANDRSVSAITAKWFVSHSQRSLCVCYYGQMVRHSQLTIVLCLLLWPNGSSVAANNSSVYYYGQMVHLSQRMILVCRS